MIASELKVYRDTYELTKVILETCQAVSSTYKVHYWAARNRYKFDDARFDTDDQYERSS